MESRKEMINLGNTTKGWETVTERFAILCFKSNIHGIQKLVSLLRLLSSSKTTRQKFALS
jgi:hypothetical protein